MGYEETENIYNQKRNAMKIAQFGLKVYQKLIRFKWRVFPIPPCLEKITRKATTKYLKTNSHPKLNLIELNVFLMEHFPFYFRFV